MIDALSKAVFGSLAGSPRLKHLASRYGMRAPSDACMAISSGVLPVGTSFVPSQM